MYPKSCSLTIFHLLHCTRCFVFFSAIADCHWLPAPYGWYQQHNQKFHIYMYIRRISFPVVYAHLRASKTKNWWVRVDNLIFHSSNLRLSRSLGSTAPALTAKSNMAVQQQQWQHRINCLLVLLSQTFTSHRTVQHSSVEVLLQCAKILCCYQLLLLTIVNLTI